VAGAAGGRGRGAGRRTRRGGVRAGRRQRLPG
jgi:hypothetical protein